MYDFQIEYIRFFEPENPNHTRVAIKFQNDLNADNAVSKMFDKSVLEKFRDFIDTTNANGFYFERIDAEKLVCSSSLFVVKKSVNSSFF